MQTDVSINGSLSLFNWVNQRVPAGHTSGICWLIVHRIRIRTDRPWWGSPRWAEYLDGMPDNLLELLESPE